MRQLGSALVVPACLVEVLQFAVDPTDGVGYLRQVVTVAVPPRQLDCLIERPQRIRHPSQIPLGYAGTEEAVEQEVSIVQFKSDVATLRQYLFGAGVLGLKVV